MAPLAMSLGSTNVTLPVQPLSNKAALRRIRPRTVVYASSEPQEPEASQPSTSSPSPPIGKVITNLPEGRAAPPRPMSPLPPGVKYERVERLGKESWAGVASVDRGEMDDPSDWKKVALLVGGDAAALLVFAAIGRFNHHEAMTFGAIFTTALPFLLGWFGAGVVLGGYGKDAQGGNTGKAAVAALKTWGVGVPAGLVLRTVSRGYLPEKAFIIVSFVVTLVLLVGYRTAVAAKTLEQEEALTPAEKLKKRKDRSGNPFEFLQLLASLTTRW